MASQGPLSPGTITEDDIGETTWTNLDNSKVSDNSYTTITLATFGGSNYILATNFGFTVPTGATVDGVLAEIECKTLNNRITWNAESLVIGGSRAAGNQPSVSPSSQPSTTEQYISVGDATDKWTSGGGSAPTVSQINNSGFGIAFAVENDVGSTDTMSVDHIRITVYYTLNTVPVIMNQYRQRRA